MTHPSRRQGTHFSSIGHCIRVNNRIIFTVLSFNPSNKNIDNHHFVFLSGLESQIVFLLFRSQKLSHTFFVYVRQFEIFLEHIFIFRFFQPFSPDFCLVFSMTNVSLFAVSFSLFYTESSSIVDDAVIGNHLVVVANVDHRCRFASYDFAV